MVYKWLLHVYFFSQFFFWFSLVFVYFLRGGLKMEKKCLSMCVKFVWCLWHFTTKISFFKKPTRALVFVLFRKKQQRQNLEKIWKNFVLRGRCKSFCFIFTSISDKLFCSKNACLVFYCFFVVKKNTLVFWRRIWFWDFYRIVLETLVLQSTSFWTAV